MKEVYCDYCGRRAEFVDSKVVYGRSYGMIYLCRCHPGYAFVGVHKGTDRPLGRLADMELRELKKQAHAAFDPLWKEGRFKGHRKAAYVSKELSLRGKDVGKHLYFHSRPLKKAEHASNVYFYNPGLDAVCVHDHDFCKTGMVQDASWMFPYQWDGVEAINETPLDPPKPLEPETDFRPSEIAPFFEQMRLGGFG